MEKKLLHSYPSTVREIGEDHITALVSIDGNDIITNLSKILFSFTVEVDQLFVVEIWENPKGKSMVIREWRSLVMNTKQESLLKTLIASIKKSN